MKQKITGLILFTNLIFTPLVVAQDCQSKLSASSCATLGSSCFWNYNQCIPKNHPQCGLYVVEHTHGIQNPNGASKHNFIHQLRGYNFDPDSGFNSENIYVYEMAVAGNPINGLGGTFLNNNPKLFMTYPQQIQNQYLNFTNQIHSYGNYGYKKALQQSLIATPGAQTGSDSGDYLADPNYIVTSKHRANNDPSLYYGNILKVKVNVPTNVQVTQPYIMPPKNLTQNNYWGVLDVAQSRVDGHVYAVILKVGGQTALVKYANGGNNYTIIKNNIPVYLTGIIEFEGKLLGLHQMYIDPVSNRYKAKLFELNRNTGDHTLFATVTLVESVEPDYDGNKAFDIANIPCDVPSNPPPGGSATSGGSTYGGSTGGSTSGSSSSTSTSGSSSGGSESGSSTGGNTSAGDIGGGKAPQEAGDEPPKLSPLRSSKK